MVRYRVQYCTVLQLYGRAAGPIYTLPSPPSFSQNVNFEARGAKGRTARVFRVTTGGLNSLEGWIFVQGVLPAWVGTNQGASERAAVTSPERAWMTSQVCLSASTVLGYLPDR